ncbi:CheA signal transduction histidine kinase [Salinarchaeum sp. Harcht-Bsk1]|uniref:chemotaxis protein CheA n=1 Tax=Salinarchaeum sp. Harcht-Bsk1 TaxID=1333523 RepID=UPI0003422CCC|nr:chemotaxis protein CheA [Salinarchaeum sp. Harcht-Bsk1]AGN00479.1 CheA signal transduction histidine kinase [Salinarchaeum sp. Harcht-Bsk1]
MTESTRLQLFADESREKLTELNNALLTLEENASDTEALNQSFRSAHTIKGNSLAMGYESVGDLSHAVEDLLDEMRDDEVPVTPETIDLAFDGLDALEDAIGEIAADGEVQTDLQPAIERVRTGLEAHLDTPPAAANGGTSPDSAEPAESPAADVIEVTIDDPTLPGADALLVLQAMEAHGTIEETDPPRQALEDGEYDGGFLATVRGADFEALREAVAAEGSVTNVALVDSSEAPGDSADDTTSNSAGEGKPDSGGEGVPASADEDVPDSNGNGAPNSAAGAQTVSAAGAQTVSADGATAGSADGAGTAPADGSVGSSSDQAVSESTGEATAESTGDADRTEAEPARAGTSDESGSAATRESDRGLVGTVRSLLRSLDPRSGSGTGSGGASTTAGADTGGADVDAPLQAAGVESSAARSSAVAESDPADSDGTAAEPATEADHESDRAESSGAATDEADLSASETDGSERSSGAKTTTSATEKVNDEPTTDESRSAESAPSDSSTGGSSSDGTSIDDSPSDDDTTTSAGEETSDVDVGSVRVDVDRLDDLYGIVEQLFTTRIRLRRIVEAAGVDEAADQLDALDKNTDQLQDLVMDMRLVPLSRVVDRFPRTVRDLARDSGKEIDLEITGEDVEVDRVVLDEISDPLLHLVRNAVDHGIEPPDERADADKPREGTVSIRARRERDQVVVVVEDDGGGLDPATLRDRAVSEGIADRDTIDAMDDDEVQDLIFHPGFSTAEDVSEVSGRGVGMDVVRQRVRALDGSVELESEQGEGTTVTLRLPVTVAIVEVLFVDVGEATYGIPIKEIDRISRFEGVQEVNGRRSIEYQDDVYPVVALDDVFDETPTREGEDRRLVRIRPSRKRIALVCDAVHNHEEVVVKPLSGPLANTPGLSGTTVLGDGNVVPIVDVQSLGG